MSSVVAPARRLGSLPLTLAGFVFLSIALELCSLRREKWLILTLTAWWFAAAAAADAASGSADGGGGRGCGGAGLFVVDLGLD